MHRISLVIIILSITACSETPRQLLPCEVKFNAAQVEWETAKTEWHAARERGDYAGMATAYAKEEAAFNKEMEVRCRP